MTGGEGPRKFADIDLLDLAKRYGPARALSGREAWYISSALENYRFATGPSKEIMGRWIIATAKALGRWKSPYSFFRRTSQRGCWTLASYHHRASLCWSWILSLSIGKATCLRSWRHPFYRCGGQVAIGLPRIVELRFHRQRSDWMVSSNAENMLRFLCEHEALRRATSGHCAPGELGAAL